MKKYAFLAIIAITTLTTSCTSDSEITPTSHLKNDFTLMQKEGDSTGVDTGGQGGSTPIKPPKP